jgi:Family of unknown function (DUF6232)
MVKPQEEERTLILTQRTLRLGNCVYPLSLIARLEKVDISKKPKTSVLERMGVFLLLMGAGAVVLLLFSPHRPPAALTVGLSLLLLGIFLLLSKPKLGKTFALEMVTFQDRVRLFSHPRGETVDKIVDSIIQAMDGHIQGDPLLLSLEGGKILNEVLLPDPPTISESPQG